MAAQKLGLSVLCVERTKPGRGGAQWVNGVPAWSFAELGLRDRSLERGDLFSMGPASGSCRFTVADNPVLDVDMRELNQELHELCEAADVDLWFESSVVAHKVDAGGLREVTVRRGEQNREYVEVCARLFVDASGLKGSLRKSLVSMADIWPDIAPSDLCAAAQYVMNIRSMDDARAFLATTNLRDREAMGWLGVHGGFSLLRVHVDLEQEEVSLLTGSIAEQGTPSGKRILQDFVDRHDWIGDAKFGGSRVIPLRRPYSVLGAGRIALIGDSASQVFAPMAAVLRWACWGAFIWRLLWKRSWPRMAISVRTKHSGIIAVTFIPRGAAFWRLETHLDVSHSRSQPMIWMNFSVLA